MSSQLQPTTQSPEQLLRAVRLPRGRWSLPLSPASARCARPTAAKTGPASTQARAADEQRAQGWARSARKRSVHGLRADREWRSEAATLSSR